MSNKIKHLQLKMLNNNLSEIHMCDRPSRGWLASIRNTIGMSSRQMAERMGISQQSASKLEKNEIDNSITLKSLRKAAEAMDCKLVYAIVPNDGNLEDLLKKQALKKAREIVVSVDRTMQLEDQRVGNLEAKIQETSDILLRDVYSKLWD